MLIASGSMDCMIRIWCTNTGNCLQTLSGHRDGILSIAFSYDSTLIASCALDSTALIWRTNSGVCIQTLVGDGDIIHLIAFSINSTLIASGSSHTVQIWRAGIPRYVQQLKGHYSRINSIAFSRDSALIATSSYDRTLRIWRVETGHCVQNIDLGVPSSHISFVHDNSSILTDVGSIIIKSTTMPAVQTQAHFSGLGINSDLSWITWNNNNILWLPAEFRPRYLTILGSTVVIACVSGRIIIFCLSAEELSKLYGSAVSSPVKAILHPI